MKEFQYGNTTVVIHSPLALLNEKEREEWYKREWENGNPVLKQIADCIIECCKNP
jgi:hypothetical protein